MVDLKNLKKIVVKKYIMEDLGEGGMDLFDYALGEKGKRLGSDTSKKTLLGYLGELFEAVKAIHAKGIFLNDLKAENVLIGPNGHVKLIDFGGVAELQTRGYYINQRQSSQKNDMVAFMITCAKVLSNNNSSNEDNKFNNKLWKFHRDCEKLSKNEKYKREVEGMCRDIMNHSILKKYFQKGGEFQECIEVLFYQN